MFWIWGERDEQLTRHAVSAATAEALLRSAEPGAISAVANGLPDITFRYREDPEQPLDFAAWWSDGANDDIAGAANTLEGAVAEALAQLESWGVSADSEWRAF